ncbi:MAG: four-helix bundle copper-binding protein [Ginsengibacter sp.]
MLYSLIYVAILGCGCAAICNHCASSCTQEQDVKMMAGCIQLDMECAAICYATAMGTYS